MRPNLIEDLPAIHTGEADVENHQVGRLAVYCLQPAGSVLTGNDLEVTCSEAHLD
jgi:hypothetical protein